MLKIAEITENNFYNIIKLSIKPEQEPFVAPVTKSLAECWLYRNAGDVFPYALEVDDEVVGFILFDIDAEEKCFMIWRLMIDQKFQGKGYGQQAISQAIEKARSEAIVDHVIADFVVGNQAMHSILTKLGFKESGLDEKNNEIIMRLEL